MTTKKVTFVCPSCRVESKIEEIVIKPSTELNIKCPKCDTIFDIKIEFYEVENE